MQTFLCPYLNGEVELTDERAGHFYRWFDDVRQGKYVVVVVVSESAAERNCIITAYMTRRLINGEIEWQKS